MYADRYARSGGFKPGSLGIALGINAAVVAALMLSNPAVRRVVTDPPLETVNIPLDPLPDPIPPQPSSDARPEPRPPVIDTVDPLVKTAPTEAAPTFPPQPYQPPVAPSSGEGIGIGSVPAADPPAPVLPVLVQPGVDPRYAGLFQPTYPPAEQRAGRAGRVVVRVLVGVDGRVKQVERVLATSDDFFRATEQRALSRWRFTPGTRDGIPVEAWRTMAVSFVLSEE